MNHFLNTKYFFPGTSRATTLNSWVEMRGEVKEAISSALKDAAGNFFLKLKCFVYLYYIVWVIVFSSGTSRATLKSSLVKRSRQ